MIDLLTAFNTAMSIAFVGAIVKIIMDTISRKKQDEDWKKELAKFEKEREERAKERAKERTEIFNLLTEYSTTISRIVKEHSEMSEDVKRTIRHTENNLKMQMNILEHELQNIKNNDLHNIKSDINKIYNKF